jgi:hypothetical protein
MKRVDWQPRDVSALNQCINIDHSDLALQSCILLIPTIYGIPAF